MVPKIRFKKPAQSHPPNPLEIIFRILFQFFNSVLASGPLGDFPSQTSNIKDLIISPKMTF